MFKKGCFEVECRDYTSPTGFDVTIHPQYSHAVMRMSFSCCSYTDDERQSELEAVLNFYKEQYGSDDIIKVEFCGVQEHEINHETLLPLYTYEDLMNRAGAASCEMGLEEYLKDVFKGMPLRYPVFERFQECAEYEYNGCDEEEILSCSVIPTDLDEDGIIEKWMERQKCRWTDITVLRSCQALSDEGYYINTRFLKEEEIKAIKERTDCEEIVLPRISD